MFLAGLLASVVSGLVVGTGLAGKPSFWQHLLVVAGGTALLAGQTALVRAVRRGKDPIVHLRREVVAAYLRALEICFPSCSTERGASFARSKSTD